MERKTLNTLMVNDDDLECKKDDTTLTDLSLMDLSFPLTSLEKFDLVVYVGRKGTKVLKSTAFRTGKILS